MKRIKNFVNQVSKIPSGLIVIIAAMVSLPLIALIHPLSGLMTVGLMIVVAVIIHAINKRSKFIGATITVLLVIATLLFFVKNLFPGGYSTMISKGKDLDNSFYQEYPGVANAEEDMITFMKDKYLDSLEKEHKKALEDGDISESRRIRRFIQEEDLKEKSFQDSMRQVREGKDNIPVTSSSGNDFFQIRQEVSRVEDKIFKFFAGDTSATGINMTHRDEITLIPIKGKFKVKTSKGKYIRITEEVTFPVGGSSGGLSVLGITNGEARIIKRTLY